MSPEYHAFIDESYRREFLLCAVVIPSHSVSQARAAMTAHLRPGQRRTHMTKERDGVRKALLHEIAKLGPEAYVVAVRAPSLSMRRARDLALREVVGQLVELGVSRLIVESCDQDRQDAQVIGDSLASLRAIGRMELHHLRPYDEPLLWIPDAVAWAFGKDATWRRRVEPLITRVIQL